ncbi:MAG: rRNA maturation RNase YbeY [Actinomycetota bacterium]
MDVFVANEQPTPVDEVRASALARHTLTSENVEEGAELSLLFVGADHMRRLNARFAGNDRATDVLAFPMTEDEDADLLLGDVVVCPEIAAKHAAKDGHPVAHELDVLVVHGILHLLGYDHDKPDAKSKMDARLREVLGSFAGLAGLSDEANG